VDASAIGLYAGDGALVVAKLLGEVDAIVYGMSMRALPRAPETRWVTSVSDELDPATLMRIVRAGGLRWLVANLSADQIVRSLVSTTWAMYGYRIQIWNAIADYIASHWPWMPMSRYKVPAPPPVSPRKNTGAVDWPPDEYAPPNANWDALDVIAGLCNTYAPGHCLIYAVPVNPDGRDHVTDPALYLQFVERLRVMAERGRMTWSDFSDAMSSDDFQRPVFASASRSRDPVHLTSEGLAKLAVLLADPIARIAGDILAAKPSATDD
jgi:hypothetical protein